MGSGSDLTKDQFDSLLAWLDSDRDVAGAKLLQICASLERLFFLKGALEIDALTDETVNRVAKRVDTLDRTLVENPRTVFWGFARNVFLENVREIQGARVTTDADDLITKYEGDVGSLVEYKSECLDDCLSKLSDEDSKMMLDYYGYEHGNRNNARDGLADRLSISVGNLHTRVFRIRDLLKKCIQKCISEK